MKRVSAKIGISFILILLVCVVFGCKEDFGFHKGSGLKKKVIIVKKIKDHDLDVYHSEHEECEFPEKKHFERRGFPKKKHFTKGAEFYLKFEDKLDLSENQVKELKSIKDDYKKNVIKKKAELKTLMVDFKAMVSEDDIDLKEVKSMIGKISDVKEALMYRGFEASVKAKEVLNSKQRDKVEDFKKDFHKKKEYHGCYEDD